MVALAAQPLYKAVCYRCNFEGSSDATQCPNCSFPLILEAESTPPGGARLEDILRPDRRPLPGVSKDGQAVTHVPREAPRTPDASANPLSPPARASRRWQQIKVAAVCSAAVAAGVLAAIIHQGL